MSAPYDLFNDAKKPFENARRVWETNEELDLTVREQDTHAHRCQPSEAERLLPVVAAAWGLVPEPDAWADPDAQFSALRAALRDVGLHEESSHAAALASAAARVVLMPRRASRSRRVLKRASRGVRRFLGARRGFSSRSDSALRREVCAFLRANPNSRLSETGPPLKAGLPGDKSWEDVLAVAASPESPGDVRTLAAAALRFGVTIIVLSTASAEPLRFGVAGPLVVLGHCHSSRYAGLRPAPRDEPEPPPVGDLYSALASVPDLCGDYRVLTALRRRASRDASRATLSTLGRASTLSRYGRPGTSRRGATSTGCVESCLDARRGVSAPRRASAAQFRAELVAIRLEHTAPPTQVLQAQPGLAAGAKGRRPARGEAAGPADATPADFYVSAENAALLANAPTPDMGTYVGRVETRVPAVQY
eukprot:CAMPEP_0119266748 /NCGR_PEP_ID=MMETSP1329-20130426/5135_1 /TAXON_ID=114041 /ORGANISM="Genus nov. species nov., Strain RCC1024" /LENGTH=420 /DNA_ID=CAMNT_0007266643 /DNA_START=188 /DNA_END=1448 /DNA_ORIENTATION=-